ncbi:MAG TPA: vanadium-dependent haloperoxidase [Gemmatimonadaceae bacterium]|nr:vanadium-dependent haloperoxidase [Gemmatimonadaceae bacterium]
MRPMSELPRVLAAAITVALSTGCADRITNASADRNLAPLRRADAAPIGEATTSVRWSAITRDFISSKDGAAKPNQGAAFRAFAYLSLAQYRAVVAAENAVGLPPRPTPQGAAAAASAVVLSSVFPADAASFESQLRQQEDEVSEAVGKQGAFAAGEAIGRVVGAEVAELARTDGFDAVWTGSVPIGPGYWSSDFDPPRPPLQPLLGQMRPFFLQSGDQFRPGPPPAFGSAEYLAALAEVRSFSDHRTAEQLAIAQFWAMTTGSLVAGFWNAEASKLIARYHLNEARAARTLALSHMAMMDANIACHDAKFTYWLIRPYRADQAISTPIGRPQHPSYPSNHACMSGTAAYVLGALFPAEAARLAAMADEAGESRLYAGIHYRFDKNAGLGIARQVAALALARDVDGKGRARSTRR